MLNDHIVSPLARQTNRLKIRRGDVEATEPVDLPKTRALEGSTTTEQVLNSLLRDSELEELELLELREKKSGRDINLGETIGHKPGAVQHRRECGSRTVAMSADVQLQNRAPRVDLGQEI